MMNSNFSKNFFTIQNQKIECIEGEIELNKLNFYIENPRIYSIVCSSGSSPSQADIFNTLKKLDHVKKLYHSIKNNGGLTDALIVKGGTYEVLEGNSRLAAYKMLAENDPFSWGMVLVKILPPEITDSQIFTLLGQYHVTGKKDWAPFEVASYVHRRHYQHNVSKKQIASELSMSIHEVNMMINVVNFMKEVNEEDPSRWSYYNEYLRSAKIRPARKKYPNLDKTVVKHIKTGVFKKAEAIRDDLSKIASSNESNLKKYIAEARTVEEALESAQAQGVDDLFLQRLKRTKESFITTDFDDNIPTMSDEVLQKCRFEINKIQTRMKQLLGKVDKQLNN